MMEGWLKRANVVLRGGGLDESPDCYKRLPEVLSAHGSTIRILHTLTPLSVAMAGANEFDPYKDRTRIHRGPGDFRAPAETTWHPATPVAEL